MTDEKTRALIAELRSAAGAGREGTHAGYSPLLRGADLATRAADALSALTVPDGDTREVREIAIEGVKIDARGRMRHDSRVWYEALESALDALLPALWDKATASALSRAAAPEPEWEYAVRWVQTDGQPITDIGADEADVRALVETQDGWCEGVRRQAGPWEPLPVGGETDGE